MKQETRKNEIINVAAKLFKEKGYSAVTMRDIATSMGIKAASLYNHISSKQEILKEIIIALAEEFTEGIEQIKASEKSSIDKLKEIVTLHISITSKNTFGMASLNNDWMHLEEQLDYYLGLRAGYEESFRSILVNGIKNNEIANKNPEIMMFSMLSTLRSLYIWIPKKEAVSIKKLSAQLSDVLIHGINK
ncbi:TetR/AcrR family transcriptional regulator [Xanthomarina sp. F1114]|uniref:TetR/AcrR family transcriptional regulator n=1 Tax=unclassified Xanthomarina TaxID=2649071 RepID=UPI00225E2DA0|nr:MULTISPECIES: TetR/AcrR family transcriptional regulator [unclassified Xanthomarina]MCX7548743.1 TetR/AcrR family transcriptional regulator [Xanthomarina sp. F1114]MCX7552060.1 TetR/AcrR family transcriptional regulator [Xanthomarina sp. F2636L]